MDNKITKKRLGHLFSYDWIVMIISFIAIVLVWEFIFQVASVRVTMGQTFKYYIDYTVDYKEATVFNQMLIDEQAFDSLNILKVDTEPLAGEGNDVLFTRLEVKDGDAIFTDTVKNEQGYARAQTIIDNGHVYTLDKLLSDAKEYLEKFKTDGQFDEQKMQTHFLQRMKNDNRFRTDEEKEQGVKAEKERILRLNEEVADFEYLLSLDDDLFFKYTRFSQSAEVSSEENKAGYEELIEKEKTNGRENARYGINLNALKGGTDKLSVSSFFSCSGKDSAENVVLLTFDFLESQPDEQFEVITFINAIVRSCSDIYQR